MQDGDLVVNKLLAAASAGDCGRLGELLRANPSLLTRTGADGRSVLHCAVAKRQLVTVKYLLGCWDAGPHLLSTVDACGNTPLHLLCGSEHLLLLLLHAGAPPPVDVRNSSGLLPQQVAAKALGLDAAGAAALFQRLRAGVDLCRDERTLLSFLPSSPLRRQPRESRFWWMRIKSADFAAACAAVTAVGCFCVQPIAGAAVSMGMLALEFGLLRLRDKLSSQSVALLLCLSVAALVTLTLAFSLVPQLTRKHRVYLACLIGSYAHLILVGPSLTVGGPADARQYWAALEEQPSPATTAMPPGFCPRSEAIRTPRSKYSPLSQGLVPVMDHDCAFVGCAIGEGNHRAFVLFLVSAVACLLVFLRRANDYMRACPDMPDLDRRAFVVGLNIDIGLLGFLAWLIGSQIWSIELNYTHAELDRWSKEHPNAVPPSKWFSEKDEWSAYMPHDDGRWRNTWDWLCAQRAMVAAERAAPQDAAARR
jgi:palmitoyltransferase